MSTVENPYALNLLRYSEQAFFGRHAEIKLFEEGAAGRPPRSFALVGPRGIGKTWFLQFLCDRSRENPLYPPDLFSIYCDLRGCQQQSPLVLIGATLVAQSSELQQQVPVCHGEIQALKQAWAQTETDARADETLLHHGKSGAERLRDPLRRLCSAINASPRTSLQICLDHFGEVLDKMHLNDEVFLRELVQTTSFVVTIRPGILSEYQEEFHRTSPFLNMMLLRHIGELSDAEARQLVKEPLDRAGAEEFSPEEISFLIDCAGRHPLPLMLACDYYFRHRTPSLNIHDESVRERITQGVLAMPEVTKYCATIWRELSTRKRNLLQNIVHGASLAEIEQYRASLNDIISHALLLEDIETGEYRLFSRVFERYVLGHEEPPSNGHHLSGDVLAAVEAELTPIDRKLWDYLRERPDQVCTRDELLEHVWEKTDSSRRGLEAAIYRIRSKLNEAGAGNWEYIQTSRRHGYKFVPRPN